MLSHKPLTDPENEPGGNVDKGGSDTEAAASLRVLLHPHSILDRVGGSLLEFVCVVKHAIDDRRTFFLVACVLRHAVPWIAPGGLPAHTTKQSHPQQTAVN